MCGGGALCAEKLKSSIVVFVYSVMYDTSDSYSVLMDVWFIIFCLRFVFYVYVCPLVCVCVCIGECVCIALCVSVVLSLRR